MSIFTILWNLWLIISALATIFTVIQGIGYFWPERIDPLKGHIFKYINNFLKRNKKFELTSVKSFDIIDMNKHSTEELISQFREVYKKDNIEENIIIEKINGSYFKGHIKRRNYDIHFNVSIIKGEEGIDENDILIFTQTSNVKFKEIKDYLSTILWNIRDINDNVPNLKYSTINIEISIKSDDFVLFKRLFSILGDNIEGHNISLNLKNKKIKVNIKDKFEIESIDSVVDTILLGISELK